MIFTYQQGEQTYNVQLEKRADGSYQGIIAGREYLFQAVKLSDGGWRLQLAGENQAKTVYTAAQGKYRYVQVMGETIQTLTVPELRTGKRRGSSAGGSGRLVAQMPGQVVDVYVAAGDSVTSGQTLLVLEAMKMEIRITAPRDGIVKQVAVKKSDVVEREQVLVELES